MLGATRLVAVCSNPSFLRTSGSCAARSFYQHGQALFEAARVKL